MSSLVDQLLYSQKRPPAEAARVAEAVTATLRQHEEPSGEAATAAEAAAQRAVSAIAAEKRPRRRVPVSDHAARFADDAELPPPPTLFAAEPAAVENVRADPYYLLPASEDAAVPEEAPIGGVWMGGVVVLALVTAALLGWLIGGAVRGDRPLWLGLPLIGATTAALLVLLTAAAATVLGETP